MRPTLTVETGRARSKSARRNIDLQAPNPRPRSAVASQLRRGAARGRRRRIGRRADHAPRSDLDRLPTESLPPASPPLASYATFFLSSVVTYRLDRGAVLECLRDLRPVLVDQSSWHPCFMTTGIERDSGRPEPTRYQAVTRPGSPRTPLLPCE